MKTQIRSFLTLVCAASASLLIIGSPAQAGYIVRLEQVGRNVVATGSGTLDLTDLTFVANGTNVATIVPSSGELLMGSGIASDSFYQGLSGQVFFGSGSFHLANSGSGDFVGIDSAPLGVIVPQGYVSGTALSSTATWDFTNFSNLGVTPGTYKWTWGTGAHADSFTLVVPDTGSTFGLLFLSLIALFGTRFRLSLTKKR